MKTTAIIVSAGQGRRFGGDIPKQYQLIGDRTVLAWTLQKFEDCEVVDDVIIVVSRDWLDRVRKNVLECGKFPKVDAIVEGGVERQDSVFTGLKMVSSKVDYVLVHDAVRPCVTVDSIRRVVLAAGDCDAAILAVSIKDTIKRGKSNLVCETLDRSSLWAVQTPQVFKHDLLLRAYQTAFADSVYLTDDSALVERLGHPVKIVEGDEENLKLTVEADLWRAGRTLLAHQS